MSTLSAKIRLALEEIAIPEDLAAEITARSQDSTSTRRTPSDLLTASPDLS